MESPGSLDNQQGSDVLGNAMKDCYLHGPAEDIRIWLNGIEDDAMPVDIFFRKSDAFDDFEWMAMEHCKGRILDLGAGAGCHSLYLQDQGFDVLALEQSSRACEVMKAQGLRNVECVDFFHWDTPQRFDTILLLMNGFGMCQRSRKAAGFLQRLKGFMADGGQIIGDSTDISYMLDSWGEEASEYVGDVHFQLVWKDQREAFDWVYFDEQTLIKAGSSAGLKTQVLKRGASHNYLVCMSAAD